MAAAVNIHNIKYFAPIAVSRLYEQRRVFQQMTIYTPIFAVNRKTQSAKNMMRNSSLLNATYTQAAAASAAGAAKATDAWPQAQQQQPSQPQAQSQSQQRELQ